VALAKTVSARLSRPRLPVGKMRLPLVFARNPASSDSSSVFHGQDDHIQFVRVAVVMMVRGSALRHDRIVAVALS